MNIERNQIIKNIVYVLDKNINMTDFLKSKGIPINQEINRIYLRFREFYENLQNKSDFLLKIQKSADNIENYEDFKNEYRLYFEFIDFLEHIYNVLKILPRSDTIRRNLIRLHLNFPTNMIQKYEYYPSFTATPSINFRTYLDKGWFHKYLMFPSKTKFIALTNDNNLYIFDVKTGDQISNFKYGSRNDQTTIETFIGKNGEDLFVIISNRYQSMTIYNDIGKSILEIATDNINYAYSIKSILLNGIIFFIVAFSTNNISMWNSETGEKVTEFKNTHDIESIIVIEPDKFIVSRGDSIELWDINNNENPLLINNSPNYIKTMSVISENKIIFVTHYVLLWDLKDNTTRRLVDGDLKQELFLLSNGKFIINDGIAWHLFNSDSSLKLIIKDLPFSIYGTKYMDMLPNDKLLLINSDDKAIILDLDNLSIQNIYPNDRTTTYSNADILPDGKVLFFYRENYGNNTFRIYE